MTVYYSPNENEHRPAHHNAFTTRQVAKHTHLVKMWEYADFKQLYLPTAMETVRLTSKRYEKALKALEAQELVDPK